ncbi:MDIS1-interacting receptor like kinase 2-like [Tripterygium wilfordii]|uniref:MDIS1-interacting receptor like kinase 2-like n=1 Tax=Tripterygium wilfordii TaxID=458696 RepID=UPI0018F7F609|nr:MDIS1-interacting receptor like kinase 2-like [Tripterygium wilfordii]
MNMHCSFLNTSSYLYNASTTVKRRRAEMGVGLMMHSSFTVFNYKKSNPVCKTFSSKPCFLRQHFPSPKIRCKKRNFLFFAISSRKNASLGSFYMVFVIRVSSDGSKERDLKQTDFDFGIERVFFKGRDRNSMAKSSLDKSLYIVLVFPLFVLLHDSLCVASSKSNEQAEALLKWKASLPLKNQSSLTSWIVPPNNATILEPCTWDGIYCKDGSVSRISLANSGIVGTLHEFPFSSLRNLAYLYLSSNKLYGSIPSQVSQLTKLIYLDLSYNQLSGNIPPEIGLLTHLEGLELGYNGLNGSITQEVGKLKSLKELSLFSNNLEGPIPTFLENCSNMTYLDLHNNLLTGSIPPTFGKLKRLTMISLSKNQISGPIPKSLGGLTKLTHLLLHSNHLSGSIPKELGNLFSLVYLELDKNKLNGSVPGSIGKLKSLGEMRLNDNRLSGLIPPEFGSITDLWHLDLSSNKFGYPIPQELGNLINLIYLSLSNNLLIGDIPSSISGLKNVENLNLSHNKLSGGIPESFSGMPKLSSIDVSYNKLQGPIPYSKAIEDAGFKALRGNEKLCGDIEGLQSCRIDDSIDVEHSYTFTFNKFIVILLPLLGVLLLVFAVTGIFIIRRKRKKDPQA